MSDTPASACRCGWKVPKHVVLYADNEESADIEYECTECGQKHVIGCSTPEKSPKAKA